MASNRIARINEEIQRQISADIRRLKDPRVSGSGMVSVTRVDPTGDLRYAKVFISVLDKSQEKDVLKGLKSASGFLRRELGHAEVRETYKVSSVGTVAGCYVQDGCIRRDCSVRVVRDGIVVHEGVLGSLQRFKDAVKEVKERYECGLTIDKFNDIKLGDIIEAYDMEEVPR